MTCDDEGQCSTSRPLKKIQNMSRVKWDLYKKLDVGSGAIQ